MHFVTLCTWTCISCLTLCVAFHYISYFHRALCSFHFFHFLLWIHADSLSMLPGPEGGSLRNQSSGDAHFCKFVAGVDICCLKTHHNTSWYIMTHHDTSWASLLQLIWRSTIVHANLTQTQVEKVTLFSKRELVSFYKAGLLAGPFQKHASLIITLFSYGYCRSFHITLLPPATKSVWISVRNT